MDGTQACGWGVTFWVCCRGASALGFRQFRDHAGSERVRDRVSTAVDGAMECRRKDGLLSCTVTRMMLLFGMPPEHARCGRTVATNQQTVARVSLATQGIVRLI